jgi:hypothetical protein
LFKNFARHFDKRFAGWSCQMLALGIRRDVTLDEDVVPLARHEGGRTAAAIAEVAFDDFLNGHGREWILDFGVNQNDVFWFTV